MPSKMAEVFKRSTGILRSYALNSVIKVHPVWYYKNYGNLIQKSVE